jgi:hypothetical protein
MVNTDLIPPSRKIRCRRIEDADAERVVSLLTRGFAPRRPRRFWKEVIAYLAARAVPPGPPRYGYLLENNGAAVGAILQIFASLPASEGAQPTLRCNLSSWYVDPDFRSYAPLLVAQALKHKEVTYLNVSSAPHTRPILEAQGYKRYADGILVALPFLSAAEPAIPLRITPGNAPPHVRCETYERDLLKEHAARGCITLWCETAERAYPFVFRTRWVKRLLPCEQLIYCRHVEDFVRFARPLGRYLARRGRPLVILDANGPMRDLRGKYFADTRPKYFKGPVPPRLGALAYTETAFFGV